VTSLPAGRRALFVAAVAANLALLYSPRTVGTGGVPHLDKVAHAMSFGLVMWSGLRAGLPTRWLAAALAVHAVASEVVQHALLPGRSGDPADVLADLVGVAGVLLWVAAASWRDERDGQRRTRHGGEAAGREPDPR